MQHPNKERMLINTVRLPMKTKPNQVGISNSAIVFTSVCIPPLDPIVTLLVLLVNDNSSNSHQRYYAT